VEQVLHGCATARLASLHPIPVDGQEGRLGEGFAESDLTRPQKGGGVKKVFQ
jgi:hypothetical protein